jgi:23S rRNA (uridine2552-2'-O)-methyltransferase
MSWWMNRQKKDTFVKKRNKMNLLSRAFFKIKEINEKYNLINNNCNILELGAAPGGWTQYLINYTKNITAIDIDNNFKIPQVKFICGDINSDETIENLGMFDLILSDISVNISGNSIVDNMKMYDIYLRYLHICKTNLNAKGTFVAKVLASNEAYEFFKLCKLNFNEIVFFKPESSRSQSREKYIICTEYNRVKF